MATYNGKALPRDKTQDIVEWSEEQKQALDLSFAGLIDVFYPVGTIYESTSGVNPSTFMGGTWEEYGQGRVTVALNTSDTEFNSVGKIGGSKTHKLTYEELPRFKPEANANVKQGGGWSTGTGSKYMIGEGNGYLMSNTPTIGGDEPHNNLQPYIVVYRFRRTQ